ncbi:Homeodomain-like protein, partial [Dimargaris cristalligena]
LNFVLKAKRKRATPEQVHVLNQVFEQTYFPSTEVRRQLALQLSMTPRTVQIWFQNKRQALRTRNKTQGHFHPHHRNPPTS